MMLSWPGRPRIRVAVGGREPAVVEERVRVVLRGLRRGARTEAVAATGENALPLGWGQRVELVGGLIVGEGIEDREHPRVVAIGVVVGGNVREVGDPGGE